MSKKAKKVAIFDIDGTLFRSSLLIELVEGLIRAKVFKPSVKKVYLPAMRAWNNRTGSYNDYINAVIKAFLNNIKGVYYGDFIDVAKEVVKNERLKTYVYTRDLITSLKKKGYFLLAISQSPKAVLDIFCKEYDFDKVYGRIYELGPTDKFTGVVTDEHLISNKANIVKRALEKAPITLKGSIGVGDTEGDISFLEIVDNPICFNPSNLLLKHAKRMKWEVVVERKDAIYYIQ